MKTIHQEFTASERKHQKNLHKQFKKNQPEMYQQSRNEFIKAALDARPMKLNVVKFFV